jgi:hypothetical protein
VAGFEQRLHFFIGKLARIGLGAETRVRVISERRRAVNPVTILAGVKALSSDGVDGATT